MSQEISSSVALCNEGSKTNCLTPKKCHRTSRMEYGLHRESGRTILMDGEFRSEKSFHDSLVDWVQCFSILKETCWSTNHSTCMTCMTFI